MRENPLVMSPFRVFLIGAGFIARHHASAVSKLPISGEAILFVADPDPEALASFKKQFPNALSFSDAYDMLAERSEPDDVVIVATPPFTHFALTCAALNSNRHVLCEKPLAMDQAQALKMLRLACAKERLLGCCSTRFLGLPSGEGVKRLLREGDLGELYHVTFVNRLQRGRPGIEDQPTSTWFLDQSKSGGGVVMDWGPYDFTTLNYLLEPQRVDVSSAWMVNPVTELNLPNGAIFNVEQHAGASLHYHLYNGKVLPITYERAVCTHGGERIIVEIEGLLGAVSWNWLDWLRDMEVVFSHDENGKVEVVKKRSSGRIHLSYNDRPLYYFWARVQGEKSLAVVNEQAVFNFFCVRALYDCAMSGQPQSVCLEKIYP